MLTKFPFLLMSALILAMLLAGCGTVHRFIPPMPLKPGEIAGSVGVSWSTSRFASIALQGNAYVGLTGRDLFGVGFNDFILPTSFSYAHYIPTGAGSHANLQLHASVFGPDPRYEADIGYAMSRGELAHAFRLGLGYMGSPRLSTASQASSYSSIILLPVVGYDLRYRDLALGVLVQPGLTRHFARAVREKAGNRVDTVIIIERGQIFSIEREAPDSLPTRENQHLGVMLKDRSFVTVVDLSCGESFIDRFFCNTSIHDLNLYTASPDHRNYYVITGRGTLSGSLRGGGMELNLPEIVRRYEETGVLMLAQDPDVVERALDRIIPGLDDLGIGVAYISPGR